jgi:transcriptional regulator with XRE-family HTH domain
MTLAEKLRTLREQRNWSQRELAKRSELAPATLSHLENGKFRGDLTTHQKLARALGLTLGELYRGVEGLDLEGNGNVPLSPTIETVETFRYNEKAQAILLASQVFQKPFLPQLLRLQPGGQTHMEQTRPGCERWVFVLKGAIDIQIGEQRHRLEPYGSIFFKASEPHQLTNAGDALAECLMVTSPVEV